MRRKALLIPVILLLAFFLVGAVASGQTTLTTTVPGGKVTVTLSVGAHGSVRIGKQYYRGSAEVTLPSNMELVCEFVGDSGYSVKNASFGGKDVTEQLENGSYTSPVITEDTELTVTFMKTVQPQPRYSRLTVIVRHCVSRIVQVFRFFWK